MLEAWLIGGACAVVAFGLGLLVGTKTSETYLANEEATQQDSWGRAIERRESLAWQASRTQALADAITEAERVREAVSTRSLCGRAIVARLRQLADADAGAAS